jgi:RNA polymerase sigma factor (sigma-70 family)
VKEVKGLAAGGGVASEPAAEATAEDRRRAATALIESHDAVFRRTARRYSICSEDAEDAYQRSLEILLTKAPRLEGDALVRWMQVVTKREALHVRRQRERLLSGGRVSKDNDDDRDPIDSIASDLAGPTEQAASRERVTRSREALRALKPQELRALMLKAQGYTYAEIGEITGWTYTKINRCMAEGRKRFLEVFADIEEGKRCAQLATALSAMADGERDVIGAEDVSVHLKTCGPCRAKLRAFRAIPDRVLELTPTGPAVDQSIGGRAHEWVSHHVSGAIDKVREGAFSVAHRGGATEGETAAGLAGGLQASAAKALAICGVAVAGSGGAYCVVNGIAPGDLIPGQTEQEQTAEDQAPVVPERPPEVAETPAAPPATSSEQAQRPATSEAPLTQSQQTNKELGFEQAASPTSNSSSGGEFGAPASGTSGGGSSGGGGGGFGFEK